VSGQRKEHRAPGHQTAEENHRLPSAATLEGQKSGGVGRGADVAFSAGPALW